MKLFVFLVILFTMSLGIIPSYALINANSMSTVTCTWPIIVAPEEIGQGKDLVGYGFSPYGGTYIEIKHGSKVIWSNFADSYDDEVLFSVRIGRNMTGVLTINAEDINGNQSSQEVGIIG